MADRRKMLSGFIKRNGSNGGYGPKGTGGYKRIEDEGGGQAERTAGDQQTAAYVKRRRAAARSYSKGPGRPD